MHVWFWLVFFYGPLYLAATCLVLFLPEECSGGFFWETTSGWMPYSDPSLVRQWIHISVSLRVGLVARGVRETWNFSGVEFRNLAWFDSGYIFVSLRSVSSPQEYEKIVFFLESTSGFVPGSSLCLVRQRIHLRQSTRSCRISLLMRRGGFPWSRLLSDQRGFPVRPHGGRIPFLCGSCRFSGAFVEDTLVLPQLQLASLRNLCRCAEFFFVMVIDVPVVLWCRIPVPSWWRQS